MKKLFHHIWVGYGKNKNFVRADWVHEDAVEAYKAKVIADHKALGWMKEFCFIENMKPCIANKKGKGSIFGVGSNGEYGTFRVS